eukprot:1136455-Pelagomonas_calceolata.AAC.1
MVCHAGLDRAQRPTTPGLALVHLRSHAQSNRAVQAGSMLRFLGPGHGPCFVGLRRCSHKRAGMQAWLCSHLHNGAQTVCAFRSGHTSVAWEATPATWLVDSDLRPDGTAPQGTRGTCGLHTS